MPDDHFAGSVAERYDDTEADMFAADVVAPAVDRLIALACGGRALEFGVGTGRIALPLHVRGVDTHGIDLSPAMIAQLRRKPRGSELPVTVGDVASTVVDGAFALVYLVFNTLMNLATQAEQVACFRNAARHLAPGGRFVVEVMVPDLQRLPHGDTVRPFRVTPTRLGFDEYDVVTQRLVSHHYVVHDGRLEVRSIPFRYVWPAELDLMAQLAGMSLRERWGGWSCQSFTSESTTHVSVWEKPPA